MNGFLPALALFLASPAPGTAPAGNSQGVPAEASPTFRDPITRDPMLAKSLSLMSPGMGHYYNGSYRKMRKYQRRSSMAILPFAIGFGIDVHRKPWEGVDQWKDLTVKKFPWYAFGGWVLSGVLREKVREADADEAYTDALRLRMGFEESPATP